MDAVNWHSFFFYLFSLITCGFAVGVVLSSNIVRMALYLIVSLGATSGLFFAAGADFVGAMQLMIYVGGTLVLLIFGVMLTSRGPFVSMKTGGGDWILACLLSGCLLAFLLPAAFSVGGWRNERSHDEPVASELPGLAVVAETSVQRKTATSLGKGLLGPRVDKLLPGEESLKGGMSGYLLPFEIVSVHLLVVLVGAAYLARTKRRAT